MRICQCGCRSAGRGKAFVLALLLSACGGGGSGGSDREPFISIEQPTTAASYATPWTDVRLGGRIARASFVHVRNTATDFTTEGYVFYNEGEGTWFADVAGLVPGDNRITVTADEDGLGEYTSTRQITVVRPLQPVEPVFNGPDRLSATTHWADAHSIDESHAIALFADGTGRATTGSALTEPAGAASDFTWTLIAPDAILVSDCPTCSFQKIMRISGDIDEALFLGQIETVGGLEETALHAFVLTPGNL